MFKMKYIKFKMKFFYCVFTTHVVSISEKKISRGTVYSIEFYHFMKKEYSQLWAKQIKQDIFKLMGIYGF